MKEEKTEDPTPKKLEEARKEGRIARSPELGGWAVVLVFAVVLHQLVGLGAERIRALLMSSTSLIEDADTTKALALLGEGAMIALVGSLLIGAAVLVLAVALSAAQGGVHMATKAAKPKWSRLNPLEGAKRLLGPHAWWEGAKVLIKSAIVALLVWRSIHELMPLVRGLVPLHVAIELVAAEATRLLRDVAVAGLLAGAVDYAVQRRRIGKQNRMTLKEVKDEHKQSEGDPMVRHHMRSRAMENSRNRQMADVATADVVLVNPTHVAVALRYDSEQGAPRVVAKGAGAIAARIRERAETANVAMVEDVPLARALHAACNVGDEIPAELYAAVAQVLAFIVSRRTRGASGGRHRSPRHELDLPEVPRAGRRRAAPAAAALAS